MKLYLLRHGVAVARGTPGCRDEDRPLTKDGAEEMALEARGIRKLVLGFDAIVTSPLKRANDTAHIVAQAFGSGEKVKELAGLAPGGKISEIQTYIERFHSCQRVLLVGHEPHLGSLIAALLSVKQPPVELKKGGLCLVRMESGPLKNRPTIGWLLTPRMLRRLGRRSRG